MAGVLSIGLICPDLMTSRLPAGRSLTMGFLPDHVSDFSACAGVGVFSIGQFELCYLACMDPPPSVVVEAFSVQCGARGRGW